LQAANNSDLGGVTVERDVAVVMRDGAVLRADVYRPRQKGSLPVLLQRTPYNKRFAQTGVYQHPVWYARQGYIVAIQDVRGRFASDGTFEPYRHETEDGHDTIGWAAALEGSTGAVGTFGFSYAGVAQLMAAALRPPGLRAAAIGMAGNDFFEGWTYRGGALQLAFIISWAVQALGPPDALRAGERDRVRRLGEIATRLPDAYRRPLSSWLNGEELPAFVGDWLRHSASDQYWEDLRWPAVDYADLPCLHIGGWYDIFLQGTLAVFEEATKLAPRNQRLVVGPWQHVPWARLNGSVDYGPAGDNSIDHLQVEWFDRHLKGIEPRAASACVRYYQLGANRWRDAATWPPPGGQPREFYLRSGGRANSLSGDGSLSDIASLGDPPDIYVFDPVEPVPSVGGASCCRADVAPVGAFDQRGVEIRNDVLVYTSEVLASGLDVCGPVEVVLFAATDCVDTDWTAKLVDVAPDGTAINLCDGILRARYRLSSTDPAMLTPGEIYEYRLRLGSIANHFGRGHAIRLEISSSNFPAYDVNDNSGAAGIDRDPLAAQIATQSVFHDVRHPSRLILRCLDD
jgi:putative CocE/NonD family hydrolase